MLYPVKDETEQKPKVNCDCCGCGIYEGDHYYNIGGEILCNDCLEENHGKNA